MKFNIQVRLYNETNEKDEEDTKLILRHQNVIVETSKHDDRILEAKNSRGKVIDSISFDDNLPMFTEKIIEVIGKLNEKYIEDGRKLKNEYLYGKWLLRRNR